ncbi:MAG: P-loop NTPase [Phycisphaerales bacterium]|jgi:flagellar biosynthesis protein FlhG
MESVATESKPDQASRLRAMVQSVYGPGVAMITYAEKAGPPARFGREVKPESPRIPPTPPEPVAPTRTVPVIAITSGKGGVGKTSISVNLSIALSKLGRRVSLLDADLGLANADLLCGMNPTNRLDAAIDPSRTDGQATRLLSHIAVDAPGGFKLVPGSAGLARMANLSQLQRTALLAGLIDLEAFSDVVLVDTGAGLSDQVTSFVAAADLALVVVSPDPTSIADAYAMIKCVARLPNPPRFAIAVNMADSEDEGFEVHGRMSATCRKFLGFNVPLFGVVRRDAAAQDAVRARVPMSIGTPRARASRDIERIAERVVTTLGIKPGRMPEKTRGGFFSWLSGTR